MNANREIFFEHLRMMTHTDCEYTFANSCTYSHMSVCIKRFFYTFLNLAMYTWVELHNPPHTFAIRFATVIAEYCILYIQWV